MRPYPPSAGTFSPEFAYNLVTSPTDHMSSRLIYADLDVDPTGDPNLLQILKLAGEQGFAIQIGLEPNFLTNSDLMAALENESIADEYYSRHVLSGGVAKTVLSKFNERSESKTEVPGLNVTTIGNDQVVIEIWADYLRLVRSTVSKWAKILATVHTPIYLRPMSELNLSDGLWELHALGAGNTPMKFAQAWIDLHDALLAENNVTRSSTYFLFDVSSWSGIQVDPLVSQTLDAIPPSYIDALGIHPYADFFPDFSYPSFQTIVDPWLNHFRGLPRFKSHPLVIGEMGVRKNLESEFTDFWRAQWIHQAFQYACKSGIKVVTYFNGWDGDLIYSIDPGKDPEAFQALNDELSNWKRCGHL